MPKLNSKLTESQLKNAKPRDKAYKLGDGDNLQFLVRPSGSKVWQYPYVFNGKHNTFTIGKYPFVKAAMARKKRDELRHLLDQNIDPASLKENAPDDERLRFQELANEWFERQVWVTKHKGNIQRKFQADVLPKIGHLALDEIKPIHVIEILKAIEARGAPDVAKRTAQHISSIFDYAIVHNYCEINPALGRGRIIFKPPVKHRAYLKQHEMPEFLEALEKYKGGRIVYLAIQILLRTMVRPGELRFARWDEFDIANSVWRIPAARMKMKREHVIPLSSGALRFLTELREISGKGDLLFPGNRSPHKPISDVTLLKAIQIMGFKGRLDPHGLRGTASTILNEEGFRADAIERQLAHIEKNKVRASYHHSEYLDERRAMLEWYSEFLEDTTKYEVVPRKQDQRNSV